MGSTLVFGFDFGFGLLAGCLAFMCKLRAVNKNK